MTGKDLPTPLVVDVDGTLIGGNLLFEGISRVLGSSPFKFLLLPFWLLAGRASLKRQVAQAASLPVSTLVLNSAVLKEIELAKAGGQAVWLASGADESAVRPLAEYVGASGVLASDGSVNLVGQAKADRLTDRFGEGGFDYIGNERRDLAVWRVSRRAVGVNLSTRLVRRLGALASDFRLLPGNDGRPIDYLRSLRPHQWIKNTLVFLPLAASHSMEPELYLVVAGMFVALSACTSATYVFNDLIDLPHDRKHETKRHRPMAAGIVSIQAMVGIGLACLAAGLSIAFWLSTAAGVCVVVYLAANVAYSLWLKRKTFLDVITLSFLYAVRLLIGAMAISLSVSSWLIGFSTFVFLSLAIVKRQVELGSMSHPTDASVGGRAYFAADIGTITALGGASAFASVVVLTLYLQSPEVMARYDRPDLLWLVCPLLIYWLGRLILLANRGAVDDDPVVFALRDRASWVVAVAFLAVVAAAL